MIRRFMRGATLFVAVSMMWLAAAPLAAQTTGRISGTVTSADGGPVNGASVQVVGTRFSGITDDRGAFRINGVTAGEYQLRIGSLGFRDRLTPVRVTAGSTSIVSVQLEGRPIELGNVVVSASRQAQRLTEAPATITRIDANVIERSIGNTWVNALKQVPGLDFIQVGMTSVALNARGFNSSFNNRMLMMEDGRIAVLPENGLPVGQFTASPKIDLAGVEVLIGPGAALYGADASSGVVTLQSKDPRRYPGTTVEVTGGNRSYMNAQARHAGLFGSFGYKIAGEFQSADDWDNYLAYNIAGVPGRGTVRVKEDSIPVNSIDWKASVLRGTGALLHYWENSRLEVSAGASQTDGVGQTNVGRNQLRDWQYNFVQAQYSTPRLYLNLYRTQSKSGESFALNRYADAYARNPSFSPDSLRMLSDWPSNGRLYAAEAQHNFRVPMLLNSAITWGAQVRRDVVSSERQWLTDRLTGEDLEIDQKGVYAQVETPLLPRLNLVLAGRYDDHENYDAQFSPKAGLVFMPGPSHAVRLTYNRAFKSPTTLQTNFHIPDWTAIISIFGNTEGFTVQNAAGQTTASYDALRPEENTTWEFGYKGVLSQRLFADATYYRSRYEHFMSPLVVISNPFAGATASFAYDATGNRVLNHTGMAPITLIYYNLGSAELQGVDAGLNFYALPNLVLSSTVSLLDVGDIDVPAGREEATSMNAPHTKWTFGANLSDLGTGPGVLSLGTTLRHVTRHYFRSGINMGVIPTFTTSDINAAYRVERLNATFSLGVSNLFTCSQDEDVPFAYAADDLVRKSPTNAERKCGIGMKHAEMINMPAIGTMMFIGARYNLPR
jgi:outer membrane receptor for ferrienterochelin and colicins